MYFLIQKYLSDYQDILFYPSIFVWTHFFMNNLVIDQKGLHVHPLVCGDFMR